MILVLFYTEDIKKFVISTIVSTDEILEAVRGEDKKARISYNDKNKFKKALKIFIANEVINESEAVEIIKLIDYRNDIAHRIEELTYDVHIIDNFMQIRVDSAGIKYDHDVLKRLQFFKDKLENKTGDYIHSISFSHVYFTSAEKTYKDEIKRLKLKISKQVLGRKKEIKSLNKELSLNGAALENNFDLHPYHPENKFENGRLTKRGIEICYRLFEYRKSPHIVAYLMRISYTSAKRHWLKWQDSGKSREKTLINGL